MPLWGRFSFCHCDLCLLKPDICQCPVYELERKPATINRKLASLRIFFDWLVAREVMASNPASTVKGVEQDSQPPKALSAEQVYQLQRTVAEQRQMEEAKAGPDTVTFTPSNGLAS